MVRRRGIGATLVASVVFSAILVCGSAVYLASVDYARLSSTADSANYLSTEFQALEGAEGVDLLIGVQDSLSSAPLPCASPDGALAAVLAVDKDSQTASNLTVSSSLELGNPVALSDNLTALRPFGGSIPGDLDFVIQFVGSGSAGQGAGLERSEAHHAHLAVNVAEDAAACRSIMSSVAGALSGSVVSNCTDAVLGSVVQGAARGAQPGDPWITFNVRYSVQDQGECAVKFRVVLVQGGIDGPEGDFSASFEGGGSVVVATQA